MSHQEKLNRLEELMTEPLVCEFHQLSNEIEKFERETLKFEPPTIPEMMLFIRDQRSETQRETSARSDMSLNRWKALESGKIEPSIKDARSLYKAGVPAKLLLKQKPGEINSGSNEDPTA